jgi:hypothetical protein
MRANCLFVALLVAVTLARVALLVTTQHHANGDDSAIGVMGQRILQGEWPLHPSVADRHLGSALAGYVAAGAFALLGDSETVLKLPPLAWSLVALTALYLLVRVARGPEPALLVSALYATAVSLAKWSFYSAGGYIVCQALFSVVFWLLLARALVPGRARPRHDLWLGFLCGLGTAILVLFAPAAATAVLFLALAGASGSLGARLLRFGVAFAAGSAPLWVFDRAVEQNAPDTFLANVVSLLPSLRDTLTHHLPAMLCYDNIEGSAAIRLVPNGIAYLVLLAGIAFLLTLRTRDLGSSLRSALPGGAGGRVPIEAPLLVYVVAFLLLYAVHPLTGSEARHLLPLHPGLWILAGLGLSDAIARPARTPLSWAALALAAAALANGALQQAHLFGDDGIYGTRGRSDARLAPAVAAVLGTEGVSHVVTNDWDLAWRMTFQTRGRIRSCHAVAEHRDRLGDAVFPAGSRYAVIVRAESHWDRALERRAARAGIPARRRVVFDKAVHLLGQASGDPRLPDGWCPPDLLMQPVSFGRARVAR